MGEINKKEFEISNKNGDITKMLVIECDKNSQNPKPILDLAVQEFVGNKAYNEFIDISLENRHKRIVIFGLNSLEFKKVEKYKDIEIAKFVLKEKNKQIKYANLFIIRGGLKSENPISYMSKIVNDYFDNNVFEEFTEIHLDNPWIRVILKMNHDGNK